MKTEKDEKGEFINKNLLVYFIGSDDIIAKTCQRNSIPCMRMTGEDRKRAIEDLVELCDLSVFLWDGVEDVIAYGIGHALSISKPVIVWPLDNKISRKHYLIAGYLRGVGMKVDLKDLQDQDRGEV